MGKKKKGGGDMPMMTAIAYKPPTTAQIIKNESRMLAEQIARNHPKVKKIQNAITAEVDRAVNKAVKTALSGKAKGGTF